MKNFARSSISFMLLATLLAGCVAPTSTSTATQSATVAATQSSATTTVPATTSTVTETAATTVVTTVATAEATATTTSDVTSIVLGENPIITGQGAAVTNNGIQITAAGSYEISGTFSDGMVEVNAPGATVELILNGVNITHSDGPAILFADIEQAIVTLAEGSTNTLADGGNDDEFDAALYSSNTLTIRGTGDLHVTGNNNEGISSTMHINFEGGNIWIHAFEDGVNANNDNISQINISGGYLYVETETGDGIDSNGTIDITGGTVVTLGALVDANGGLDADGAVTISGGTVIATGMRQSTPVATSPQKSIMVSFGGTQAAGTLVSIQAEGNTLLTFAPAINYQTLIYSSAEIAEGVSYDVYVGGSATGDVVDGVYSNGDYTPGTLYTTVTTESVTNARNQMPGPRNAP